ncbi:MAG: protein kinase [Pseudomonadota bacterium]
MSVDLQIEGYELIREIGEGGMARVFLGTQLSLGREVAVKVLRSSLSGGEDFQRRFLHEGQLLAKLNHPNIVPIHDIGQQDEHFYMAMEYLQGGTLSERMKKGISVAECIRICTQVAHALHLAHSHRIVHRDMKPSNIMFRDELTPVLTDFGIARKTDSEHRLTKTGMVVGTPYYMSPEQITGKDIDGRADLYSLGIMFYELLTGELPFKADEPLALAMQHVQESPPPLPDNISELQPVLDDMLAKDKDDRFPDMLGFCEAIKELVMTEAAFAERLSGETKLFNSDQFSDPRFGSGPLRVPERVTRDIARATGQRDAATSGQRRGSASAETRAATSVSGQTPAPQTAAGKGLPRWLIPAAVAGVLMIATAVTLMMRGGGSGLTDKQQAVVEDLLKKVDAHIVLERIREPADDNAVSRLREVLTIAPDYAPVLERAEEVAVFFENDARNLVLQGSLTEASALADEGLALAAGYQPLSELKAEIEAQQAAVERRRRVIDLNLAAQKLFSQGQLIEPAADNALKSYDAALELDPRNEAASLGRKRVQETVVAQARDALLGNNLNEAERLVALLESRFGSTSLISSVRSELDTRLLAVREAEQIDQLLAEAASLVANNSLIQPAGNSAVDRFQAVLRLNPANVQAKQGLADIASGFEQQAREALAQENYGRAVDLASAGLRAEADNTNLARIQEQATGALDAVDREIQQSLQEAERLARSGTLLTASGPNALSAYQRVLELDAGNQRARTAIDSLPDEVFDRVRQLRRGSDLAAAGQLAELAATTYPADTRFVTLSEAINTEAASQARQQRLADLLADSRQKIRRTPLDQAAIAAASDALDAINEEFPNDVEVVAQRRELTRAIADQVQQTSVDGNDDAALALTGFALERFPSNSALVAARSDITNRRDRRQAEEQARLAALQGQLAIDATPWGEVIEVTGPQGNASLPADATTPLILSLPEGTYQLVVRGSGGAAPVRLTAQVRRQQLVRARAEFSELDATSYFERSGW